MSELRIGKFMNTTISTYRKVSPNIGGGLELNTFDRSRSGFESLIRVFSGDTGGDNVVTNVRVILLQKVNFTCTVHIGPSVELAYFRNIMKRDTHSYLQLCRWEIHAGDTFRHRMLHLKTRVQFQEEKFASVGIKQILDCSCTNVTDLLSKTLCRLFHLPECIPGSNNGRTLLENLLKTSLRRTIASVQGNCVTVLVTDNLHL
mmetsp:Transcript_36664/g.53860  ORF Transcript_36664/g.53860 Transcript_36664/m.53860 type:complete len:203 (-) Transcript_36664:1054-1662(-)